MEEDQSAVTQEEQQAPSNETQTQEQQTEQKPQDQVEVQADAPSPQLDERGVDYKYVAQEYRRKLDEMPSVIERTVQEALAKNQQVQAQPKYTVSQLEEYAQANPQYRGWVEEQKATLVRQDLEKVFDEKLKMADQQRSAVQVRQQTEQWVTSHPKFKDCFNTDIGGNKIWNMTNPLTQMMAGILNQQDPVTGKLVKDRPDGLAIAAEMAYGRYMLSSEPKSQSTVKTLQKQLRQTQKQTMTVGQGVNSSGKSMSEVQTHLANYQKTYSSKDAQGATKAYLKSIGIIKENEGD